MALLSSTQKETIKCLADAVLPTQDRRISPQRIADRVEEFLAAADSPPLELLRTVLDGLYTLVLFKNLGLTRDELRDRIREALFSSVDFCRDSARILHILVTYIYYADPAVDSQVGYKRFKSRPRGANLANGKNGRVAKFDTHTSAPRRSYDVCIVGSGVAGSLLAQRLASAGKTVLVLEAGSYLSAKDYTDDELIMLAKLYKGGVFQSALGGAMPVLQAKCVGGGGVVNNAVCFRMPEFVKRDWDNFGAHLNNGALRAAFDHVKHELHICPADAAFAINSGNGIHVNPSRKYFLKGIQALGIPNGIGDPDVIRAGFYPASINISECVGCGYCNIGCSFDRKNNSFVKYLPAAVATGNCDVVTGAAADEVVTEILGLGHLRAMGLRVKFSDGRFRRVRAKKYIISAGAIASSGVLLRSPWISLLGLPIGERFSANVGSPLHALFNEEVHAYDGLQISDYFAEMDQNGAWGWIAESWYNPPATQSQAIPGYLDDHFARMKKYANYASVAPLVGTEPVGKIVLNLLTRQPELQFKLPDSDLQKLKQAMRRIAEIFLRGGAEEILLMARSDMALHSTAELGRIDREIQQADDLLVIGTGHPQGGNPMSDAKVNGRFRGVVGTNFKVHGVENLFVCDASVFPTSVKVNPQWTIMALADLCAQEVLEDF